MREPLISVGILSGKEIEFSFPETFISSGKLESTGAQKAVYKEGKIYWREKMYDELHFSPKQSDAAFFELKDVTIGINFHWERKEPQRFKGILKLIIEDEKLTAINIIPVEDYLTSVISSEMSATASLELLKAHAVISRSWLLNKIGEREKGENEELVKKNPENRELKAINNGDLKIEPDSKDHSSFSILHSSFIKWYDHEAHTHFDVCADDHCQRYQGITRASTIQAIEAVSSTRGEVLMYKDHICDARFSKCCGGALEEFQNCWENVKHPYLVGKRDDRTDYKLPDLTIEAEADQWIRTSPIAFCNTQDRNVLSQVLNNYDQETADFYRWKISYAQQELSELIHNRSGIDFGKIIDLIPIERGTSGRIVKLKIVGTLRTLIIGKELEIRRTLSTSHLYSSAFVIDKEGKEEIPSRFIFIGAGWGHGVGLCQIGAAVMGEKGYTYDEILSHYYPESIIEQQYH
ncbi:SpoIID/LytB domain-containing protein [Bacteroides sp.]|uniref:SpoIID/LytB domain-containing protein n=1 Tax=Bacteroides sp. TaxID=29523 RepID=UPI00261E7B89|nr:SpoIID/LytB domain-containing protein [Bacteroides sp.]MDD3038447.1 SpoIID/LytB domain-containing protein [Bacteroides sp.]